MKAGLSASLHSFTHTSHVNVKHADGDSTLVSGRCHGHTTGVSRCVWLFVVLQQETPRCDMHARTHTHTHTHTLSDTQSCSDEAEMMLPLSHTRSFSHTNLIIDKKLIGETSVIIHHTPLKSNQHLYLSSCRTLALFLPVPFFLPYYYVITLPIARWRGVDAITPGRTVRSLRNPVRCSRPGGWDCRSADSRLCYFY